MIGIMSDVLAGMALALGILLILSLVLWGLSEWDRWLQGALRNQIRKTRRIVNRPYQTISRADLDVEAANCEAGYFELRDHILHVRKFEGRHHDAA